MELNGCWDLNFLTFSPNQYVSGAQVHTWPNFGENVYEDVFTRYLGHPLWWPWPL